MPEFIPKKRQKKQIIIELLAEWGIRITASFSIIVIFLIFIFVFREAGGLIFGTAKELKPKVEKKVKDSDDLKPEVYNPETGEIEKIKELESKKKKDAKKQSIWENIASTVWQPVGKEPKYGIMPLLAGTLKVTFVALLLATPLGIFAAIYT
ncbi:MAG: hypothetical protein ACK5F4_01925, partial [Ignavibacteria bacterium]